MIKKIFNFILVEDNEDDILFFKTALNDIGINTKIEIYNNGEKAIDALNSLDKLNLPNLIFIDINLPCKNGIEILKEMKESKYIPVIMLTSSDSEKDIKRCYEMGADLYVKKPNDISEYRIILKQIIEHFLIST